MATAKQPCSLRQIDRPFLKTGIGANQVRTQADFAGVKKPMKELTKYLEEGNDLDESQIKKAYLPRDHEHTLQRLHAGVGQTSPAGNAGILPGVLGA